MTGYTVCGVALGYVDTLDAWAQYCLDVLCHLGRDSSVVIATCYGLDGPGIEPRQARNIPLQS